MLAASCSWFRVAGLPDLVCQEVHARDAAFTEEAASVHEDDVPIREDLRDGRLAEQMHGRVAEDDDGFAVKSLLVDTRKALRSDLKAFLIWR